MVVLNKGFNSIEGDGKCSYYISKQLYSKCRNFRKLRGSMQRRRTEQPMVFQDDTTRKIDRNGIGFTLGAGRHIQCIVIDKGNIQK